MTKTTAAILTLAFITAVALALLLATAQADVCVDSCVASPVSPVSPIYLPFISK